MERSGKRRPSDGLSLFTAQGLGTSTAHHMPFETYWHTTLIADMTDGHLANAMAQAHRSIYTFVTGNIYHAGVHLAPSVRAEMKRALARAFPAYLVLEAERQRRIAGRPLIYAGPRAVKCFCPPCRCRPVYPKCRGCGLVACMCDDLNGQYYR